MKRSLDPGTPLLPAIVFHLLPLAAFGSPEIRPAVASVPSAAQPMQRVWRMENARVLSRDLDKRWDGTVLMVGQGQTMLAVDLPTGRIRWSATDALPTTWEAWVDISSEHVAVTSQESIVAYSADTGRRMWARAPPCDFIPLRVRGEVVVGQCVSKTSVGAICRKWGFLGMDWTRIDSSILTMSGGLHRVRIVATSLLWNSRQAGWSGVFLSMMLRGLWLLVSIPSLFLPVS